MRFSSLVLEPAAAIRATKRLLGESKEKISQVGLPPFWTGNQAPEYADPWWVMSSNRPAISEEEEEEEDDDSKGEEEEEEESEAGGKNPAGEKDADESNVASSDNEEEQNKKRKTRSSNPEVPLQPGLDKEMRRVRSKPVFRKTRSPDHPDYRTNSPSSEESEEDDSPAFKVAVGARATLTDPSGSEEAVRATEFSTAPSPAKTGEGLLICCRGCRTTGSRGGVGRNGGCAEKHG